MTATMSPTTPTADANARMVRAFYDALAAGDVERAAAHLADDAVLHVPGRSPNTGDYEGAAAVLCCPADRLDAAAVAAFPARVSVIGTFSVGYEHIDLPTARARGIPVVNTPDVLSVATAECTMLLILAAAAYGALTGPLLARPRYRLSVEPEEPWRSACPAGHPLPPAAQGGWLGTARCPHCPPATRAAAPRRP